MNLDQFDGHTPGPWDTLVCATTGEKFVIDGPEDTAWNSLALVDRVGEDEGWKNMALIAAAPDLLAEVKRLREALSTCLWHAETDGTSFGSDFPLHDIIEVCNWALNDEEDEEE